MRPLRSFLLLSAILTGCVQIGLPGEDGGGGAGGSAPAGAGGAAGAPVCAGFRDVLGRCGELSCLRTAPCAVAKLGTDCPVSASGPATCFGGICAYGQAAFACRGPDDCACQLCGADGRCYGSDTGACGLCETGAVPPASSGRSLPCKTCLSDCQGTGPSCCTGAGCICEGVCGKY